MISKLPDVGTTIFTVMSSLAMECNTINLGQGFPDFPMSSELTDLVAKAMRDGNKPICAHEWSSLVAGTNCREMREAVWCQIER